MKARVIKFLLQKTSQLWRKISSCSTAWNVMQSLHLKLLWSDTDGRRERKEKSLSSTWYHIKSNQLLDVTVNETFRQHNKIYRETTKLQWKKTHKRADFSPLECQQNTWISRSFHETLEYKRTSFSLTDYYITQNIGTWLNLELTEEITEEQLSKRLETKKKIRLSVISSHSSNASHLHHCFEIIRSKFLDITSVSHQPTADTVWKQKHRIPRHRFTQ